jgi:Mannosyltransferase (PIG-V)
MNSPDAELAVADTAPEIAAPALRAAPRGPIAPSRRRAREAGGGVQVGAEGLRVGARVSPTRVLRAHARTRARTHAAVLFGNEDHVAAVRDSARALLASRALIWISVSAAVLTFGFGPQRHAFNPPGTTRGFGWLADLLAAPAARWDSSWYLVIAHYGYRPDLGRFTSARDAFFPLYPMLLHAGSWAGLPAILAGVLISLAALALSLYGIHRLTVLELGAPSARAREIARLAVLLTAFAPMAFFLSAVYAEALFLALSVGVFYAARQGRFVPAALFAALATATRSAGLVLIVPALVLYLYGPREDRPPDFAPARERASTRARRLIAALAPRYRVRRDVLSFALVPAALALFIAYLSLRGGDALAPFHAQHDWGREFAGPFVGVWDGVSAAVEGARQLLSFQSQHVYFPLTTGSPAIAASHNLVDFAFLLAAVPALIAVLRMLPLAYGAYVLAALALPLSYPAATEPLMSLPRFLLVLFPLTIPAARWLYDHPRAQRPLIAGSAALMAVSAAQFSTWHWVA